MALGKWIAVQYTEEEHASIKAKADEKGLSLGEHVRRIVLKHGAKK